MTDDVHAPALPPRWRALLLPSLARGAAAGAALGLALLPVALLLEAKRNAAFRVAPCVATVVFGLAVGLVGGAPAAALEARARGRTAHPLVVALVCGGLVSLAAVLGIAQVVYLTGVVFGGVEGGMHRLGDLVSAALHQAPMAIGLSGGLLLALATPHAVVTAVRLLGHGPLRQVIATLAAHAVLAFGLAILLGVVAVAASAGGKIDVKTAHPLLAGLLLFVGGAVIGLGLPGIPLALLLPPALALADRVPVRPAEEP